MNDATAENTFVWSSGESSSYRNWESGQPDNSDGGEDYVVIWTAGVTWRAQSRWNDLANVSSFGGIPIHGVVEIIPPGPLITSFHGNGQLTWTNFPGTNCFSIEWAPTVNGPWDGTYRSLVAIITTNAQTTLPVPMFYRVAQGFLPGAANGTWLTVNLPLGYSGFQIQADGIISESSMFGLHNPPGYYTINSSGHMTNNYVGANFSVVSTARVINENQAVGEPPFSDFVSYRVTDTGLCAGNWSGTLSQTNGPGSPTNYPVTFSVDNRGLLTGLTGFTGNGIGRMFALANGPCVGYFTVGRVTDNGAYYQVKIAGSLSGNSFSGNFVTGSNNGPGDVSGSVNLTR